MTGNPIQHTQKFIQEHIAWSQPECKHYPDYKLLHRMVTNHVEKYKKEYEKYFQSHELNSLSSDHTFRVSTNVGYERHKEWHNKIFDNLFIVMNGKGQVIDFKLTESTGFEYIRPLLKNIHNRAVERNTTIHLYSIDNCCNWKEKIGSIFGPQCAVKLDLYHAVQRITTTIQRKSPKYYSVVHDLRLVFRQEGDIGRKRQLPTENPIKMDENLLKFFQTWKEEDVFTDETHNAVQNLRKHIHDGCLDNIPVGVGTNRNERIHKTLNQTTSKIPRVSVQLMHNLLTLFFYKWNWNREHPTIPCPPIWDNKTVSKPPNSNS